MRRVEHLEGRVAHRVVGHPRDDPDAHAELDIGLDDIGVERSEHDVGFESAFGETIGNR